MQLIAHRPEWDSLSWAVCDILQLPWEKTPNEVLGTPFEMIEEIDGQSIIIPLPGQWLEADGKGYIKELGELLDTTYEHTKVLRARWPLLDSPIEGESLFLIGSAQPIKPNLAGMTVKTYKDINPHALRHAPKRFNVNQLVEQIGVNHRFLTSELNTLPPIVEWGNKPLAIEEVIEDKRIPRRITKSELCDLVGVTDYIEVNELNGVVPLSVYEELLRLIDEGEANA